jgi:hypothetical protein
MVPPNPAFYWDFPQLTEHDPIREVSTIAFARTLQVCVNIYYPM